MGGGKVERGGMREGGRKGGEEGGRKGGREGRRGGRETNNQTSLSHLSLRYVQSWIDKREVQSEKANLTIFFDRYVPPCLETLRHRFKKITPVSETSMIQTLCYLLEALLTPENTPPDSHKELYEMYFVFAAVWAFGGAMFKDQVSAVCVKIKFCGGGRGGGGRGGELRVSVVIGLVRDNFHLV